MSTIKQLMHITLFFLHSKIQTMLSICKKGKDWERKDWKGKDWERKDCRKTFQWKEKEEKDSWAEFQTKSFNPLKWHCLWKYFLSSKSNFYSFPVFLKLFKRLSNCFHFCKFFHSEETWRRWAKWFDRFSFPAFYWSYMWFQSSLEGMKVEGVSSYSVDLGKFSSLDYEVRVSKLYQNFCHRHFSQSTLPSSSSPLSTVPLVAMASFADPSPGGTPWMWSSSRSPSWSWFSWTRLPWQERLWRLWWSWWTVLELDFIHGLEAILIQNWIKIYLESSRTNSVSSYSGKNSFFRASSLLGVISLSSISRAIRCFFFSANSSLVLVTFPKPNKMVQVSESTVWKVSTSPSLLIES